MSLPISAPTAPQDRSGFQVAIFCALPLEAENVLSVFDVCWEDQDKQYEKAPGDQNAYNTGVIGNYNVVLVHMHSMGGNSAALAAAGLRSSFRGIQLALVVGICGVVPVHSVTEQEIVLGDVIISTAVVQYDLGRQFPGGFRRKREVEDSLSRANPEIRSFTNKLTTRQNLQRFSKMLQQLVQSEDFQTKVPTAYPGVVHDHLYEASYLHQHRSDVTCEKCLPDVGTCSRGCDELFCEEDKLVTRYRLDSEKGQSAEDKNHTPLVHTGRFGSANTVMKSGIDRNRLSAADELTAFEMEGAGVWEQYPTIVIKAACDYADSHKNKEWQKYAAAMAAGGLKVFLKEWIISQPPPNGDDSFKPIWHVPFDPMPGFVGREDELRHLEQNLLEPHGPRIAALLGLGGVGKSRLALELALRIRPKYSVLWVQASDQSTFENDILGIGMKLGIPGIEDKKADVKKLVMQRLSNSERRWILILDNADDEKLWGRRTNPGSTQTSLAEYLPRTTIGSILITTRSKYVADLLAGTGVIELPTLPPDKAIDMFIKRLQKADLAADRNALSILLDQLAYLPLALVQAASYINKTQRPIQTYIDLLARSEKHILKLLSEDFGDRSRYNNAINPVAATWLISFKHIQTHYPLAASLLSRMATVHEKRIPQSILLDDDAGVDDIDLINAVAILTGYSFITSQTVTSGASTVRTEMYDLHRLVRLAARNWLKLENTLSDHTRASILRLVQLFPARNYEYKSIWTMYLPHAQQLIGEVGFETFPERYKLIEKMGLCFVADGDYEKAVKAHSAVVNWAENLGVLDQRVFNAYGNLGEALRYKGEWSKAEQYLRQAFNWQMELLGKDNVTTLFSMSNLAEVLSRQGKHSEAEQMHRQVVEIVKVVLGKEHPDTLISINGLAKVLRDQGKYSEAEQMHRQVVEVQKRVLGKEHPHTLTSISSLAIVLRDQGNYSEAEQMHRQVVKVGERVLGKEHPHQLFSMNNLAGVLRDQGEYSEAEQMHRQVVEVQKRVLGKEHPHTLTSMSSLAIVLRDQGKYSEAEQMHRQVIKVRERVRGKEHPHTLTSIDNLAGVLSDQGKYSEAEQMHRQVIKVRERVLGEEHPYKLTSMNNLAVVLRVQGKYSEAEQMHRQVVQVQKRVLGKEHPHTLTSISNLAIVLRDQGKYSAAEQMYRQISEVEERVLGKEHPSVLISVINLASVLSDQGKYSEAEQMFRWVIEVGERVLGKEHPNTLTSMNNLARALSCQGRFTEAEEIQTRAAKSSLIIFGSQHPHAKVFLRTLREIWEYQGLETSEIERRIRDMLENASSPSEQ